MNIQKITGIIVAIVASVILVVYMFIQSGINLLSFTKKSTVTINKHTITVSLAKTEKEKQVGLSEKTSLSKDTGMLFTFETADTYGFWMKKMKFPIDMVFITDNKVTTVFKNVTPPPTGATIPDEKLPIYTPSVPSNRVLELPSGASDTYSIKVGDSVEFSL